ncbi:MAG: hypothetical protein M3303_08485 [Gemmatimonadota bacterium]|nr:hypothetical protein [Gemmatimonadota bacterium]
MEPGFDRLVIVLLVILASLLDLVVRWTKKRNRRDESPVHHEETVAAEDAEAEPWESEWQLPLPEAPLPEAPLPETPPREALPPEAPPPEVPPPEAPGREVPPWREPPTPRMPTIISVRPPSRVAPAQPRTRMLPAREVARLRRPLFERAGDARRAIVLMAVLGPCRALDPASRDVISER